ncbi:MAG TPA: hypothetical protein VFC53_13685 [Dehalococcoidia bacterium]|nr:hypothetical protein [Dehalococcoidia bacterium]
MRTLSGTLLAAQQSASSEPYVDAVAENVIAGVRRLDFAQLNNAANAITRHDAAVPADGSLVRARIESGTVKQQRIADPTQPWANNWNNLQTGKGALLACAANGQRVAIVYTDAAGTGIKLVESTDSGQTFGAEVAVATAAAAAADLAVAYKNATGDLAVAWAAGATLSIIKRTAGAFGAAASAPAFAATLNGVALAYLLDWNIAVTGTEQTTNKPTLWTHTYGDGIDFGVGVWGTAQVQQQAETDAQITYQAPFLAFAAGCWRMTFVEVDAFTGGATRTYRSHLHPTQTWPSGSFAWRTPVPVNYSATQGLALAVDTAWVYECAPDLVQRASAASVSTSLTSRLLVADVRESADDIAGHLDVDNSDGQFQGPPAPLQPGNRIKLSWGYKTPAAETSRMADLEIAGFEYRRTGGVSALRIYVASGWAVLRRDRQRTAIFHAAGSLSYQQIIARAFNRAGLLLTTSGNSARSGSIKPAFAIAPTTSAYEAVRAALDVLPDRIIMLTDARAKLTEPLSSQASGYTFGAAHPVYEAEIRVLAPDIAEAHAIGAGAFGEAIDYAAASYALGTRHTRRDITSTSGATAAATAAAHLRQAQLDADAGRLRVPPHVGLEPLDVIDVTDELVAQGAVKRRVQRIRWRYDVTAGHYDQTIDLGAV